MTSTPTLNETAALERHNGGPAGLDLANAGAGLAAAADASIAVAWAQKYAVVYHVVDQIVDTPLFPVGFWPLPLGVKPWDFRSPWLKHPSEEDWEYAHRRRIAAAGGTTAALWGEGYGWSPPQSWRLIYVANGKASLYAEGVLALLRGAGFGVEKLERSETRAALRIRRPGAEWQEYEFTWADAVRAGYVPREGPNKGKDKGGNEKYHTDPKTMLWARAVTTGGRIEAPDVLAGMPVAELVDDEPLEAARNVEVSASVSGPERPVTQAGSEKLRSLLGPVRDEQAAREDAQEPSPIEPQPLDPKTWAAINERFRVLGGRVTGPGQQAARLYVIGRIVGRVVEQGRELTADEGDLVLSTLQGTTRERLDGLLDERNRVDAGDQRQRDVAGPPLPGEDDEPRAATQDDVEAEADDLTTDSPEPAADEGRPAALDGVTDPWDEPGVQS